MTRRRKVKPDHSPPTPARVWGIESNEDSPACGEIVCPVIFLWKKPGGITIPDNMSGALKHGAEVMITSRREVDGREWVKVENTEQEQAGWCMDTLVMEEQR